MTYTGLAILGRTSQAALLVLLVLLDLLDLLHLLDLLGSSPTPPYPYTRHHDYPERAHTLDIIYPRVD